MSRRFGSNFGRQIGSAAGSEGTVTAGEASQVRRFKQLLLDEVDLQELALLDNDQRKLRLERILTHLISREGIILANRERTALVTTVINEAVGLGVLEPLLGDDSVSEVMINGHDTVYIERFGKVEQISSGFTSEAQLLQTIDRIVSTVNRRVDESSPMVDARLPADDRLPRGARVNVILPPLALNGPTVTIRLFPKAYGMAELLNRGTLDRPTADLLAACVRARLNIIVSGGTASGKTTMLNALSAFIPERERIVTIEDAAELSLSQEHVVRLETRPPNVDGKGQVTIRDLVRNSLRMRPDRIIVGEVRGGEALDMLQAMNTGHEGSLATVHANTADDALSRLETLATMSDVEVPFAALRDQVNSAVDVIVQLTRSADGQRRITEVAQVVSRRREDFILRPIMEWDDVGDTPSFQRFRLSEALHTRLRSRGEQAPAEFAEAPEPRVG
ncbi:CpaF family protein [Ornithinimicrobium pekingense]|uniref:Secretion protein n=1 Tax=Ornithinimicrobium pekingense TaxID=384677 RepID=A0ABQ2FBR1_9MICO|nr:CpaF family protein [Ornithinimicrobium pekingense]GGK80479.1 secretion protein [Ornithinimicrobium pekingense]